MYIGGFGDHAVADRQGHLDRYPPLGSIDAWVAYPAMSPSTRVTFSARHGVRWRTGATYFRANWGSPRRVSNRQVDNEIIPDLAGSKRRDTAPPLDPELPAAEASEFGTSRPEPSAD